MHTLVLFIHTFIFVFFTSTENSRAGQLACSLSKFIITKEARANYEFLAEVNALNKKYPKGIPEEIAAKVINKYKVPVVAEAAAPTVKLEITYHKAAKKELERIPAALKEQLNHFYEIAERPDALAQFRSMPGKWHLEKYVRAKTDVYSVRLNSKYRILFQLKNGGIEIINFSGDEIHSMEALILQRAH